MRVVARMDWFHLITPHRLWLVRLVVSYWK